MQVIREVEKEDIEKVTEINTSCLLSEYCEILDKSILSSIDMKERVASIYRSMENSKFYVYEEDGIVKGYVRFVMSNCYSNNFSDVDSELCAIYVDTKYQRCGIGTKLLQYVIEELKKKDKKKLIIWCLKSNSIARTFYTKMGGEVYAERKIDILGKEYDEIAYEYNI